MSGVSAGPLLDPLAAAQERQAQLWFKSSRPDIGVDARHHTVPAFYLRRFADKLSGKLVVRNRSGDTKPYSASPEALAVRDFYTVVNTDGELDGRMEQLLSVVESEAASVIQLVLSPYRRPGRLTMAERSALCQFIAFQMVRGPRHRREIELQADYYAKLRAGHLMTDDDLRNITALPHPNQHLLLLGPLSEAIYRCLMLRPVQIARIDKPMFVTCDEPVVVDNEDHVKHVPDCSLSRAGIRRRERQADAAGTTWSQVIHIWTTRPNGVQVADSVFMPLTPTALLVLGRIGYQPGPEIRLADDEAREIAEAVNEALIAQSYEWVAANPDHPSFRDLDFPSPGPLIGVCDGGSIMSEQLTSAPSHRWQRLRKDWLPMQPGKPN